MPDIEGPTCAIHKGMPIIAECINCGRPICSACKDEFGYFCSHECLKASKSTVDHEAKIEFQKQMESTRKIIRTVSISLLGILALVIVAGFWWFLAWYFDKSGSMAWEWKKSISPSKFHYLKIESGRILFKSGPVVCAIDQKTGQAQVIAENKLLNDYNKLIQTTPDGALLAGEKSVIFLSYQGKILWRKDFKHPVSKYASDENHAVIITRQRFTKDEYTMMRVRNKFKTPETTMYGYQLSNGTEAWKKKLLETESIVSGISGGNGMFAYVISRRDKTGKKRDNYYYNPGKMTLEVAKFRNGLLRWRIQLKSYLSWGPYVCKDRVMFILNKRLAAVAKSGKVLWTLPGSPSPALKNGKLEVSGNRVLANNYQSVACIDIDKGEKLWSKKISFGMQMELWKDKVYYLTSVVRDDIKKEEKMKIPPTFEQLQDKDMSRTLNKLKNLRKYVSVIVCLDSSTGKELWRRKRIRGSIFPRDKFVVTVGDAGLGGMLSMIGGSKNPISIVSELETSNGKLQFKRKSPKALIGPFRIIDDMLIGLIYSKDNNSGGFSSFGRAIRAEGLIAIRLK